MVTIDQVQFTKVASPEVSRPEAPVLISDKTYQLHFERLRKAMAEAGLDAVVIYADKEHGDNFYFFTGWEPRFEEAALVVRLAGTSAMVLGNEMYKMHQYSRLAVKPILCPYFSLPNQPMEGERPMSEVWAQSGLLEGDTVGLIGWKMFTSATADNELLFDMPYFWVQSIQKAIGDEGHLKNAAHLLIDPDHGIRTTLEADEIAYYENNAALASLCIQDLLYDLKPGANERELANHLVAYGQTTPCHPMCATGERFNGAQVSPRDKIVQLGDRFTTSMSLRGGLTCRAAYVAHGPQDLPEETQDYVDALARPYFAAVATWYETIGLGVTGGQLYDAIEQVFPKEAYGWFLNPGHLCASEEWMSSPFSKSSADTLKSGMILQMDIIPSMAPYASTNAEEGVALADEALRRQLETEYPALWQRVQQRRAYMMEELGIRLKPEVLPLSNLAACVRPFLLDREMGLKVVR